MLYRRPVGTGDTGGLLQAMRDRVVVLGGVCGGVRGGPGERLR